MTHPVLVPSFGSRGARPPVVVVVVVVVVLSSSAFWNLDSLQSACSHSLAFSVRRRKTKKKKTKVVVVIKVKSIHCPRPPFPPSRYTFPPPPTQLLGANTTQHALCSVLCSVQFCSKKERLIPNFAKGPKGLARRWVCKESDKNWFPRVQARRARGERGGGSKEWQGDPCAGLQGRWRGRRTLT